MNQVMLHRRIFDRKRNESSSKLNCSIDHEISYKYQGMYRFIYLPHN